MKIAAAPHKGERDNNAGEQGGGGRWLGGCGQKTATRIPRVKCTLHGTRPQTSAPATRRGGWASDHIFNDVSGLGGRQGVLFQTNQHLQVISEVPSAQSL